MWIIRHKNIFFVLSGILMIGSIVTMAVWGLNFGIDFTGGSIVEVSYPEGRPTLSVIEEVLSVNDITDASIREAGVNGYLVRTPFLEEHEQSALVESLGGEIERLSSVGPTIGAELREKALVAILVVIVAIILFIAFAFRKKGDSNTPRVPGPSSWTYGITAVVALVHDVLLPAGVISVLGVVSGVSVDSLFVMALLAILGYSVNDTIVVFDRVRENLRTNQETGKRELFADVVGRSLSQTYTRSINTSLTTLLVLGALFVLGGPTIHTFILTLIVGVLAGTYSSIFLASPLLVLFAKSLDVTKGGA